MKTPLKFVLMSLLLAGVLLSGCSYPGGAGEFVKTRQYGNRMSVRIDQDATQKLLAFNFAPRDEKFARSLSAGDLKLAKKYVTLGNVNKPISGVNPLGLAAGSGSAEMVDMLLENGANPKAISRDRYSAAGIAASRGYLTLARQLVSKGAGTAQDVEKGSHLFAANQARIKKQNQQAMAFGLKIIGLMLSNPSGGSGASSGTCRSCGSGLSGYSSSSHPGTCSRCISFLIRSN